MAVCRWSYHHQSTQLDYIFLTNSLSDCVSLRSTSPETGGKPSVVCHLKWMWYVLCLIVCADPHQQSYRFPLVPFQCHYSGANVKKRKIKNDFLQMSRGSVQTRDACFCCCGRWSRSTAHTQNRQIKLLCLCKRQMMQDLIGCHHKRK